MHLQSPVNLLFAALDHKFFLNPIHLVSVGALLCLLATHRTYITCNISRRLGSFDRNCICSEVIAFLSRFFQRKFIEFLRREEGAAGKTWLYSRRLTVESKTVGQI